jgi:hypothetical protein
MISKLIKMGFVHNFVAVSYLLLICCWSCNALLTLNHTLNNNSVVFEADINGRVIEAKENKLPVQIEFTVKEINNSTTGQILYDSSNAEQLAEDLNIRKDLLVPGLLSENELALRLPFVLNDNEGGEDSLSNSNDSKLLNVTLVLVFGQDHLVFTPEDGIVLKKFAIQTWIFRHNDSGLKFLNL